MEIDSAIEQAAQPWEGDPTDERLHDADQHDGAQGGQQFGRR
jgi:hypothetical protein